MVMQDGMTYVGIDIAALTLAVHLVPPDAAPVVQTLSNAAAGWEQLRATLTTHGSLPATTLLVLEATGSYWQGLATALHSAGWAVSVISPGSARAFARARMRRAKTDTVDAALLADYAQAMQPAVWSPPPAEIEALQLLLRQRDDLLRLRTETRNRQHALARLPAVPATMQAPWIAVLRVIEEQVQMLDAAIKRQAAASVPLATQIARVQTIVGVGLLTAAVVVAETRPLWGNATPQQVVAYAGLDPAPKQSGTSVRGAGHISKTGNARLRQAVYMAALAASRYNPVFKPFYDRLLARGKQKKVALVAVARKLLALMVTLLIHERDFDPAWRTQHAPAS